MPPSMHNGKARLNSVMEDMTHGVLQCVAVGCSGLQCATTYEMGGRAWIVVWGTRLMVFGSILQYIAVCCSVLLQCVAVCYDPWIGGSRFHSSMVATISQLCVSVCNTHTPSNLWSLLQNKTTRRGACAKMMCVYYLLPPASPHKPFDVFG